MIAGQALATVVVEYGINRLTLPAPCARIIGVGDAVVVITDDDDFYPPRALELDATGALFVRLSCPPSPDARRATIRRAVRP